MLRLVALYAECDAHTAADAKRRKSLLGVAFLHLVQQRNQNPRARGADRVADGYSAAVDVDDLRIPAHVAVDRDGLGGEGLIGLDQLDIVDSPACAL